MMKTLSGIGVLMLLALPALALVDVGDIDRVTLEVPTRHVPWAKPLPGGPLKTLVIAPRYGLRDLAELGQRLELDWTVAPAANFRAWGAGESIVGCSEAEALERLEAALKQKYDLIIIGNVQWSLLPRPQLYEILKQVRGGAGLVYVPFEKTPELLGQLFDVAPAATGYDWIGSGVGTGAITFIEKTGSPLEYAGVLGQGRLVILRWPSGAAGVHSLISGTAATWNDYELAQQLLVRSCLWASKRAPQEPLKLNVPESLPRVQTQGLALATPAAPWQLTVWDAQGQVEVEQSGAVGAAAKLAMPLKAGTHVVALRLMQDGKIIDSASAAFKVTAPVDLGEITFDKPFVEVGQTVQGSVPLTAAAPAATECIVSVFDLFGQEISRQTLPVQAGATSVTFSFQPRESPVTLHRVRVSLLEGPQVAAERWAELRVPTRGHDDLEIIGWALPGGNYIYDSLARHARKLGFTASIFSGNLNAGIRPVPYTTSYRYSGQSRIASPCYSNPDDIAKEDAKLTKAAEGFLSQGLLAYSLGDENTLSVGHVDVCLSPTCLASFRKHLQGRYGSLEALNAQWGTRHASWDDVMPMDNSEAQKHGNLAPFIDHRLHQDEVFADAHARAQEILHRVDPQTPVGPEGLWNTSPLAGFHWARFGRELGLVNVYSHEHLKRDLVRTVSPREGLHGMWYGSYDEDLQERDRLSRLPWMMLLHDQNSIWWYGVTSYSHTGNPMVAFAPDHRPMPHLQQTLPEWKTLHEGMARLLMNMQRQGDGIAVLYSRPSAYAFGMPTEDIMAALEDAGFQCDAIPAEDLDTAPVNAAKYRVLVLPGCRALSDKQAAAIEAFAAQGGTVIADLLPGLYDEHATLRPEGRLNRLFGLKSMATSVREAEGTATVGDLTLPVLRSGQCELADGQATGRLDDDNPAVITRREGRGRAIYLNFNLQGYEALREKPGLPAAAQLMRVLLATAGVKPQVTVTDAGGAPVARVEAVRYADGPVQVVGLLRETADDLQDPPFTVQLPSRAHVYDARAGKYLGQTDSLKTPLGAVGIYGLLPYRVTAATAEPALATVQAGQPVEWTLALRTDGVNPGRHVLHVELAGPEGSIAPPATNLIADRGRTTWTWHVPHNAAPGQWRLQVRDAMTGQTGSGVLAVRNH